MNCYLFPGNNVPMKKYENIKKIINFSSYTDFKENKRENKGETNYIFMCHSSGILKCFKFIKENNIDFKNINKIICIDTVIIDKEYFIENINNFSEETKNNYLYFFENYNLENLKKLNIILFKEIFNFYRIKTTQKEIQKIF